VLAWQAEQCTRHQQCTRLAGRVLHQSDTCDGQNSCSPDMSTLPGSTGAVSTGHSSGSCGFPCLTQFSYVCAGRMASKGCCIWAISACAMQRVQKHQATAIVCFQSSLKPNLIASLYLLCSSCQQRDTKQNVQLREAQGRMLHQQQVTLS